MKRIALTLLLAACSSSGTGGGGGQSLYGNWLFASADGTRGIGLTMRADNTYTYSGLVLTSPKTANAQIETGTMAVSGSKITFTPTQYSCPGPDTVSTETYTFQGQNLELADNSGATIFQPNNAPTDQTFSITIGCFDKATGNFTKAPLAPVKN